MNSMKTNFNELKQRTIEINDVRSLLNLLHWDQAAYMPSGGAEARARQMAMLGQLAHEKLTHPMIQELLEKLQPYEASLAPDSNEASLIRVARQDYAKAIRVPAEFKARLYYHLAESYHAWEQARPANDFASVRPYLEKTLDLSKEYANYFPGYEHIADPLIDAQDNGVKAAELRMLFAELREQLVPLIQAIGVQPLPDYSCLQQSFPEHAQLEFGFEVIKSIGYDFERGRQDKSAHPFSSKIAAGDVRITTRVDENEFSQALFNTLHEAGHALYAQGIHKDIEGTCLDDSASLGVDESQARLWENIVGRSRSFWQFFYPRLQKRFPGQLQSVSLDQFYRAINRVQPSLIRTDADEVTYDLHIIMRFDFELELLEGKLAVRDLPDAWRERFKTDFSIVPSDNRDGVLQDVHWFEGLVGGQFQSYTIGNILSTQFFEIVMQSHPTLLDEIAAGKLENLHHWLKNNIYQHGRKFSTPELVKRVTGGALTIEPYIRYLQNKYGELYNL